MSASLEKRYDATERLVGSLWFWHSMNTAEIAAELHIPEARIECVVARLVESRHRRMVTPYG